MAIDPFAPAEPENTNNEPAPKPEPKEIKNVSTNEDSKVTMTFKGGSGFDAPWIVIHADDLDDAMAQVSDDNATTLAALMEKTSKAGAHFASLGPAKSSSGGGAPAARQEAPAGAPEAPGPDWQFKSGVSKAGKSWKAWMPPRGSDEKPVFF